MAISIRPAGQATLLLLASFLLSLWLHRAHFSTDIRGIHAMRQSQTMWNIRNFARHDPNILNPRVNLFNGHSDNLYRYEFPVMQWVIGMAMRVFGEHIWLVRLIMFGIGALGVLALFGLLRLQGLPPPLAAFSASLFQFSPVFFYYTINPLPDVLALSASLGYLYFIVAYDRGGNRGYLFAAAACLTLATLAKLPYLMFSVVSIYYFFREVVRERRISGASLQFAGAQLAALIPALLWYAWVIPGWGGNGILYGIFRSPLSWEETREVFTFYYETLFPHELLNKGLWVPFVLGLLTLRRHLADAWLVAVLAGITLLYVLLEYNMILNIHDYYMLPLLPWLFLVTAAGFRAIGKIRFPFQYLALALLYFLTVRAAYLYTQDYWSIEKSYFNPDIFIHQEALKNAVPDGELCVIANDRTYFTFSYTIDKMGYVFRDDQVPGEWVEDVIRRRGVRYMYCDSRAVEQQADVAPLLDSLILEAGSVRVWRLVPAEALDK